MMEKEDRPRNPVFEQWLKGENIQPKSPQTTIQQHKKTQTDFFSVGGSPKLEQWRDKDFLVVRYRPSASDKACKKVDISPGTCAVCGLASQPMPISKTIYWHSTWLYLLLMNLLVYAIAAVILRRKIICQFELCEEHQRRRTRAIRQAWIVIPLAIISPFLLVQILSDKFFGFIGLLAVLSFVFSCLFGHFRSRVIWSGGMTKDYAWFGGVSKEYLTSLPTWTGSARPGANAAFIASIVVAIPILGVLIGLLLPAIQQARRAAQRSAEEKVSLPQQAPIPRRPFD